MADETDDERDALPSDERGAPAPGQGVDDAPVVSCSRCDREWSLGYELDELRAGNQAVEQFAIDHMRHTGHYPDAVTPWVASCRRCPAGEAFLAERPARRWARTHARHTRHDVALEHGDDAVETVHGPAAQE